MRTSPTLVFILGLWLGGTCLLWGVATYNFAGIEHMAARNPRLAEQLGFDPADAAARKESLIWVHSSELNRVFFECWGKAQLALGALALGAAMARRQGLLATALLLAALGLASYSAFALQPEIVEVGRKLDFAPRQPPPPELEPFQKLHTRSLIIDGGVLVIVIATSLVLLLRRGEPARDAGEAS